MNLEQSINNFLRYLEIERGKSPKTYENYGHYLSRFLVWGKENQVTDTSQITQEKISDYRVYLNRLDHHALKKKTQNYHMVALRAFLKYLSKNDIKALAPEKIELAKEESREINFLNEDELENLINAPDMHAKSGLRDKAVLEVLFSTGMRVSELTKLDIKKIDFKTGEIQIKGKGGKSRIVFLSKNSLSSLKTYLDTRKDKNEAAFVSGKDENIIRLTPRTVQRILKKYSSIAGITKKVTPHVLRHTFGTDLLRSGADLRAVQEMMGHSSITTTQIYTHVTDKHLREVHDAFHGRRRSTRMHK